MMPRVYEGVELVVDAENVLGESVVWCDRRRRVYWTDIEASTVWEYDPQTGDTRTWRTPARVGSLAVCNGEPLLIGLEKQIGYLDLDSGQVTSLADVERDLPETRVNDGRCDSAGNFVFGTLNDRFDGRALGAFYQYSAVRGLRRLALPQVRVANSICFSPDGRTLYYCDSTACEIRCCRYDPEAAAVSDDERFTALGDGLGGPDGSVVDAQGYLWNAQWGRARIVRYSPRGEIDAIIPLRVPNPTCVAFGGTARDELYITTSRMEMSPAQLAAAPHAGGLYRIGLPIRGGRAEVFCSAAC
jgi:L-arabinonolactonase